MCSLCLEVGLWSVSVDQGLLERHGLGGLEGGVGPQQEMNVRVCVHVCVCVCVTMCERDGACVNVIHAAAKQNPPL